MAGLGQECELWVRRSFCKATYTTPRGRPGSNRINCGVAWSGGVSDLLIETTSLQSRLELYLEISWPTCQRSLISYFVCLVVVMVIAITNCCSSYISGLCPSVYIYICISLSLVIPLSLSLFLSFALFFFVFLSVGWCWEWFIGNRLSYKEQKRGWVSFLTQYSQSFSSVSRDFSFLWGGRDTKHYKNGVEEVCACGG